MRVTKLLDPVTSGPPLSSTGVLALAGLTLACLGLMAALVLTSANAPQEYVPMARTAAGAEPSTAALGTTPEAPKPKPQVLSLDSLAATFPAEARPIPTEMITRVEDAASEPLEIELGHLLEAIQTGFGERSVQVEPTIRPYVFRMAGRLTVRSDSFRIAVTAPDDALATARAATLRRLFDTAGVPSPRLSIGVGSGPHALSLVSD